MTKQKWTTLIRLIRPGIHIIILAIIYRIAYLVRTHVNRFRAIDIWTTWVAKDELLVYSTISIIFFVIISIIQRRYDLIGIGLESNKKFFVVRWQWTIIITCLAYFGQWWIFLNGISRLIILVTAGLSLIVLPLLEIVWRRLYTKRTEQFAHTILILGRDTDHNKEIIENINLPSYYQIHKKIFSWQFNDKISEDILILVGSYTPDELQHIIDTLRLKHTQLYHIGDNHFVEDVIYTTQKIWWLQALRYTASQIEWRAEVIKRLCDIVGSIIGITMTSPILLLTALAIKSDSTGPIFYRQERVWKNGDLFLFTKFRSMYTHLSVGKEFWWEKADQLYQDLVNSHANIRKGELPKIKDDPRVTRVGRFIRATSIDELPNLFSVLQWDMSLIWPRPHLPTEIASYKPRQRRVLSIKPGITWYAQIHGRDKLTFDEEASKELEYIQNRSLRLDLYILFATIGVIFWGKGK